MENLDKQDLEILIEAVDEWVSKDLAGNLMSGLFEAMLTDKADPIVQEKMKQEREARNVKEKQEKEIREEQAIMLKAKLVSMKQDINVNKLVNG